SSKRVRIIVRWFGYPTTFAYPRSYLLFPQQTQHCSLRLIVFRKLGKGNGMADGYVLGTGYRLRQAFLEHPYGGFQPMLPDHSCRGKSIFEDEWTLVRHKRLHQLGKL